MFPPSDAPGLGVLEGEAETAQASHDPLEAALRFSPKSGCGDVDAAAGSAGSARLHPHVGVLRKGEAVIVPSGWWHYAASLERSVTTQVRATFSPTPLSRRKCFHFLWRRLQVYKLPPEA